MSDQQTDDEIDVWFIDVPQAITLLNELVIRQFMEMWRGEGVVIYGN